MSSWLDEVIESNLDNIKEESIANISEFKLMDSGFYVFNIDAAYIRKTDSGAEMFELKASTEDGQNINWSTCTRSGDAKGNAATWTVREDHSDSVKKRYPVGTKVPLPGYQQLEQLFSGFGSSLGEHQPTLGKIEHKQDTTIDAKIFKSLTDKKFGGCVRQYENEYNNEISIKLDIEMFLTTDGNNAKGELVKDKFIAKCEKTPIKLLKKAKAVEPTTDVTATGW